MAPPLLAPSSIWPSLSSSSVKRGISFTIAPVLYWLLLLLMVMTSLSFAGSSTVTPIRLPVLSSVVLVPYSLSSTMHWVVARLLAAPFTVLPVTVILEPLVGYSVIFLSRVS